MSGLHLQSIIVGCYNTKSASVRSVLWSAYKEWMSV